LLVCLLSFAKSYSKRDRFNQLTNSQQTNQHLHIYIQAFNMQIKYYNIIILLFALSCWMLAAYMVVLYANMRMHIIFDDYSIIHSLPNS